VKELNDKQDSASLIKLVEHLLNVEGSDSHGRVYITPAALDNFLEVISDQDEKRNPNGFDVDGVIALLDKVIPIIRKKDEDFPDQLMRTLKLLSQCHLGFSDDKKNYKDHAKQAAFALGSFNFEKGQGSTGYADQVEWYLDTAEFYLDADMPGPASQQIKKAQRLIPEIPDKKDLRNKFKLVSARVSDCERKFQDAAMRYLQISQSSEVKDEDHIHEALKRSVLCAVLANAGPARSRTLAMLYSDERTRNLPSFAMLEKMFKGRIIRKEEVESFHALLLEHQKVANKQGQSLLQQAVVEHNMLAASQIYRNIHISQLAVLLDLPPAKAEKLAWKMIEQGRMKAVIDQVEGYVEFLLAESGTSSLYSWDVQIQDACVQVNEALEAIAKRHPSYKF
jgi:COP9 signalosome complex subunit 4